MEIPGYGICYLSMEKLGRRVTVCVTLLICGVACLTDALLDKFADAENPNVKNINITTFLIGNFLIAQRIL